MSLADAYPDRELIPVEVGEKVKSFYLKKKGTRCGSTLFIFSPEGIIICGDLCPGRNGVVSNYGYGISWFISRLESDYLASKFLEKQYVPECAKKDIAYIREGLVEEKEDLQKERAEISMEDEVIQSDLDHFDEDIREIDNKLELIDEFDDYDNAYAVHDLKQEVSNGSDGIGWDYDPRDEELLHELQVDFAAAYCKLFLDTEQQTEKDT